MKMRKVEKLLAKFYEKKKKKNVIHIRNLN